MNINLQVRLYTASAPWLCFKHAILHSVGQPPCEEVHMEVDSYDEYYGGPTSCVDCRTEDEERLPELRQMRGRH